MRTAGICVLIAAAISALAIVQAAPVPEGNRRTGAGATARRDQGSGDQRLRPQPVSQRSTPRPPAAGRSGVPALPGAAATVDPLAKIALIGVTQVGDRSQAWLVDLESGRRETAEPGRAAFGFTIRRVEPESVVLTRAGREFVLRLGQKRIPAAELPVRSASTPDAAATGAGTDAAGTTSASTARAADGSDAASRQAPRTTIRGVLPLPGAATPVPAGGAFPADPGVDGDLRSADPAGRGTDVLPGEADAGRVQEQLPFPGAAYPEYLNPGLMGDPYWNPYGWGSYAPYGAVPGDYGSMSPYPRAAPFSGDPRFGGSMPYGGAPFVDPYAGLGVIPSGMGPGAGGAPFVPRRGGRFVTPGNPVGPNPQTARRRTGRAPGGYPAAGVPGGTNPQTQRRRGAAGDRYFGP